MIILFNNEPKISELKFMTRSKRLFLHIFTPISEDVKLLTLHEINLFQILYLSFMCKNRTTPLFFQSLHILKSPSWYSIWAGTPLSKVLKRIKFDQFSISLRDSSLQTKLLQRKVIFCNSEYYFQFKYKLKEVYLFSKGEAKVPQV